LRLPDPPPDPPGALGVDLRSAGTERREGRAREEWLVHVIA
jgi:hypothetical protein